MNSIISFIQLHKLKLILVVLIILVIYLSRYLLFSYRTKSKIREFELAFTKNIDKQQRNYCNTNRLVADFFYCSSYNPFLTGFLKYDYTSIDMLKKVIIYGCRYIELEIFNNTIKNDTIPVVASGNDDGTIIDSQSVIDCEKLFEMLSVIAFSEKYIDNYKDPLFIFLNLKTGKNKKTLDKLYSIIKNTLNHRLLDKQYSYQKVNIATEKICNIMNKIVILSSDGHKDTKLDEVINMSTSSPNLNRLSWDELPHKETLSHDSDVPEISLTSKSIQLSNNAIYFTDNSNFLDLPINKHMIIKLSGAIHNENNTFNALYTIKKISKKAILLSDDIKFTEEEPSNNSITLQFFNKSYSLKNLHKQNKSTLTIVHTQYDFFNFNYDPETAWLYGCQFVSMNFQKIDRHLKKYMNKFKKDSIVLKPSHLRNEVDEPDKKSLSSKVSRYIEVDTIPIIKTFLNDYHEGNIIPYTDNIVKGCCINKDPTYKDIDCSFYKSKSKCDNVEFGHACEYTTDTSNCNTDTLKIICDKHKPNYLSLSPNHNNENSIFEFVPGLDDKYKSISIKFNDLYVTTIPNSCYIKLLSIPTTKNDDYIEFKNNASFLPVNTKYSKDSMVSFLQQKLNKETNNKENYYLKIHKEFDIKEMLYKETTNDYKFIGEITINDTPVAFLEPNLKDGFKSIGHLVIKGDDFKQTSLTKYSVLLKGAISSPIDFKIVWTNDIITLWKPIPANDFVGLGLVASVGNVKPELNNFCCVALPYVEEIPIHKDSYWKDSNSNLSLWETGETNYFIASPSLGKPSEFSNPVYSINTQPRNYLDRMYMSKMDSKDIESYSFSIKETSNKKPSSIIPFDLSNVEKTDMKIKNADGEIKCIGLPMSYWSDYYKQLSNPDVNISDNKHIGLVDCKNDAYFGTNFKLHSDRTIRLNENQNYCLEKEIKPPTTTLTSTTEPSTTLTTTGEPVTTSSITIVPDTLVISKCDPSSDAFKFIYTDSNQLVNKENQLCVTKQDSDIIFSKCNTNDKSQEWIINQGESLSCVKVGDIVYIKRKLERHSGDLFTNRPDNTKLYNRLNEHIDYKYFHFYVKGTITSETDNTYTVELYNNLGTDIIKKNSNDMVLYTSINRDRIKKGTKVLCEYGGLSESGYSESNMMWEATIIDTLEDNKDKVIIFFNINSIEANLNKSSMGRPRINEETSVSINSIILKESDVSCT
jgi:hypothetical protein